MSNEQPDRRSADSGDHQPDDRDGRPGTESVDDASPASNDESVDNTATIISAGTPGLEDTVFVALGAMIMLGALGRLVFLAV